MAALEAPSADAGALRGWLARVVRNFALQRGRGEQRRTAREHGAARPERIPSTADVLDGSGRRELSARDRQRSSRTSGSAAPPAPTVHRASARGPPASQASAW